MQSVSGKQESSESCLQRHILQHILRSSRPIAGFDHKLTLQDHFGATATVALIFALAFAPAAFNLGAAVSLLALPLPEAGCRNVSALWFH